jgi:hypothetical protein
VSSVEGEFLNEKKDISYSKQNHQNSLAKKFEIIFFEFETIFKQEIFQTEKTAGRKEMKEIEDFQVILLYFSLYFVIRLFKNSLRIVFFNGMLLNLTSKLAFLI